MRQTRRRVRHGAAGRSRRALLTGVSVAVVAVAAVVTPRAFAGTLPGLGGGARHAGGGLAGAGPAADARQGSPLDRPRNGAGRGAAGRGAAGGGRQASGPCPGVELVFARGTGEPPGLGIVGRPLARALADELPGRTVRSFAVVYPATADQAGAGSGATNMTRHLGEVATNCPDTRFVIGGYSQGATVTDVAIGIRGAGTPGEVIPAELRGRVAAVVVYGNPLGLRRRTIAQASPDFGAKAAEFCNTGDPVCGNGGNLAAHLAYPRNGTVPDGARFAAAQLGG